MTPTERYILMLLVDASGGVVTPQQIAKTQWPDKTLKHANNSVKVHIHRLRKIGLKHGFTIANAWARGYAIPASCRKEAFDALCGVTVDQQATT